MLAQPLAFSLIVHHDCSSRSQAFIHARDARAGDVLRSSLLLILQRTCCVCYAQVCSLYAPLLENALRSSSLIPATALRLPCASLALALRSSSLHRRSCLQQPCAHSSCTHRPSSSLILSSIVRSSTLELEKLLLSSLLVHAHARERLACVLRSSTLPLRSLARERLAQLRSSSLLLATALSSLIVPHRRSCL